jgi:hypothetical protein
VGARTLKDEMIPINLVDEDPIRFDMAITAPNTVPYKLVIAMDEIQWLTGNERSG